MSVNAKMTAIADQIRAIRKISRTLSLDDMESQLYTVKSDIANAFNAVGNKYGSYGSTSSSNLANAIESIPNGVFLNFEIVGGTTEPSYPDNNTIWVKTDTTITGWQIGVEQPAGESGKVWISVGEHYIRRFNALQDNVIYVYPVFVKQYIDGVWVSKDSLIYQSGGWQEWVSEVCVFEASQLDANTANGMFIKPFTNYPRASEENGFIRMSNTGAHRVPFFTSETYDLTDVSKIVVGGYSNYADATFGISLDTEYQSGTYDPNYVISRNFETTFAVNEMVLDVSNYEGNYYIAFAVDGLESVNIFTITLFKK